MSDTDHNASASDGDHLAAEYALGVLDATGRREAERRIARDPVFAREVAFWEARLTPLADAVAPVEPPAHLWDEVEQRLDFGARSRPGAATAEQAGIWQKLAFWRGLAFGSLGLAAASLVGVAVLLTRPPVQPPLIATLAQQTGGPAFVASVDRDKRLITVIPAAFAPQTGRVPELWLIPPGGNPRSLGLLNPAQTVALTISNELLPHANPNSALAVSIEPPGGSPTGLPTGPVVAQGRLTAL
jgi:anti-sigma-K factor RskA